MKTVILVSLVLLSGCGKATIDPTFEPYIQSFEAAGNVKIEAPIDMHFGSIPPQSANVETDGLCESGLGVPKITIDADKWATYSESARTLLVWHELGHCILGRAHNNTIGSNNWPVSVMYWDAVTSEYNFETNQQPFIDELFEH